MLQAKGRSLLLPFLPKPGVQLHHCVGTPIPVPKVAQPSDAQVLEYQQKYIDGLIKVYNDNKAKYGKKDSELRIV